MNIDTGNMKEYADFLEENSRKIVALCDDLEENIAIAIQCMDQKSGMIAARNMTANIENIRSNVPVNDDACKRLILALKRIDEAQNTFGGR